MNNRIKSIDALRTLSILAVILIHTTTKVLEVTHYNLDNYLFTLFLNQISRFAVPLFFLISGFVLELSSEPELDYWEYIKKRFSKIVIPYIFWSLIYYFLIYNQNHDNLLRVFLVGNASYQLYFIPTLCIFYLLFPVLHKIYRFIANIPVLIIIGSLQIWLMNQDYFVKQFSVPDPLRIFTLSFFFFILGIVASHYKDKILEIVGKLKILLVLVTAGLAFYVFYEGRARYFETYNIKAFYSQWRPSVLLYTLSFGPLMLVIFEKVSEKIYKIINELSKLSYLVFFIHIIILEELWKYLGGHLFNSIIFDPIFFVLVATLSFGAAYVIHRIPHLSKITG